MLKHFFKGDARIQALREGSSGSLLEGFAEALHQAGYAEITARRHIRAAEHTAYWLDRLEIKISDFTEDLLKDFALHLKRCRCPGYGRADRGLFNGARLFLKHLRSRGLLPASVVEPIHDPVLLVEFRHWMKQQRGTCDPTLYNYGLSIKALLTRLGEDPARFDAQSLRQFVLETSRHSGWAKAKQCTTALRMFLRFLISEGQCADNLDAAIPALAHWRLSSLPQYLQPDDVERVIAACDLHTPVGKRDHAILLLLVRLGLRAGDIVQLHLGDIDWKAADIRVSGKGRRHTRLPLTQEIGDALASYLQSGRPQTSTDVLFIHSRAPFLAFKSHCAVSALVARAMHKAGVSCPSRGAAHVLRHSAATSMLRHGASLKDIAAVLRHRSIETTQIYAKVDVTALQRIAQPWPEVQPC